MPNINDTSDLAISVAATKLGRLWCHQSRFHSEQQGFGFVLRPDVPNSLKGLRQAWHICQVTKRSLPVSSLHNNGSIYVDPLINGAFRHVHAVMHMIAGLSFNSTDELELATIQLESVRGAGFGPNSLEHRVAHGDMVGMIMAFIISKAYPKNQKAFVMDCVRDGIDVAVEMDQARSRPPQGCW